MNVPPYGNTYNRLLLDFANLRVEAQDTPNLTVKVSTGGFWYYTSSGASYIECAGGNSGAITPPGAPNNKWILVTINSIGGITLIDGSEGSTPSLPTLPRARFPLAAIYITYADGTITNDMIFDVRPAFAMNVTDHRDLQSVTVADSHPASAITFTPGASGLISVDMQDAILEIKTMFDDVMVHCGSSGTSGSSGTRGTSGTSGINTGTSGTSGSGTSGTSGSSGSSGTAGSSGSSGSSGTRGTSGTS